MARWEDALDALLDTWKFWRSDTGSRFGRAYGESLRRSGQDWTDISQRIQPTLEGGCLRADPIYVDPDMMTLIEYGARTFELEPLLEGDLVTDHGFMVLPRPMTIHDVRGLRTTFRAIQWMPIGVHAQVEPPSEGEISEGATWLPLSPERQPGSDVLMRGLLIAFYHGTGGGPDQDEYDERDPAQAATARKMGCPLLLNHLTVTIYGERGGKDWEQGHWNSMRFLQVALRLMQQRIAVRGHREPGGQYRGRAERSGHPARGVTLITLRRPKAAPLADEEGHHVDWSSRWINRAHWRWQWHPKLGQTCGHRRADGTTCTSVDGYHKQIWIAEFVKGPPDKPLVIKPVRAFELVR